MSSCDASICAQSGAGRLFLREATLDSALQPETVMPVQFYGSRRGGERTEAVKRLISAVLEDAVRCFEGNLKARSLVRRQEFREAENWLFRESEREDLFSFENVCDALGVDPNRLRRALSERRENLVAEEMPYPLSRRSPMLRKSSKSVLFGARPHRAKRQTSGRRE